MKKKIFFLIERFRETNDYFCSFVVSTDADSMKSAENSMDLILNTVSASHQLAHYLPLLVSIPCQTFLKLVRTST